MAQKTLFPHILGYLLLDEKGTVIKRIPVKDAVDAHTALSQSEWGSEEEGLLNDALPDKVRVLGFKKPRAQVISSQDIEKLTLASAQLILEIPELRKRLLLLTKLRVRESTQKDLLIMQAAENIEEVNKSINLLAKRLREWYELSCPEVSKAIADHEAFARRITSGRKDELLRSMGLSAEQSMGAELPDGDIQPMLSLAQEILSLYRLKASHTEYLDKLMQGGCPNILAVAGSLIGAKLIALAGGLSDMAQMPASKIQLLGAEKALFRHLRNKKCLPPKYGILHEHPLIAGAKRKDHGKIARLLADKISIASRVDFFKGEYIGEKLKKQIEARLG